MLIPRIIVIMILAAVLLAPMTGNAKIGKFPAVDIVAVNEINKDWVKISLLGQHFNPQRHTQQSDKLAAFVCELYNRTAIQLSLFGGPLTHNIHGDPIEGPHLLLKNSYYLYACALP